MSFLFKPIAGFDPVGSPVDPAGPSGKLVEHAELIGVTADQHHTRYTDAEAIAAVGAVENITYRWHFDGNLPGGLGEQYLGYEGGFASSSAGLLLPAAGTLQGITASTDTVDGTRDYRFDIVSDPGGGAEAILGSIAMTAAGASRLVFRRDLAVAIAAGLEIGCKVVRTAGGGGSSWNHVLCTAEFIL